MIKARAVALAMLASFAAGPAGAPPALAAADPAQELARLDQELTADQAKLNALNDQVERAQADLDDLSRRLAGDQQRQADLDRRLAALGRMEYEQPVLSLSTVLGARSLDELMTDVARARVVADRQRALLEQAGLARRQDQQARDRALADLARVQAAHDQAAQVAARTAALRDAAGSPVLRARAQGVVNQATARPVAVTAGGGGSNHFAFGYCTWYVANRRPIPWFGNAIEWWPNARPYGYAEGQTPAVGAVMVTRESGFGHVAYVESVSPDGSWTVSEMNYTAWDVVDTRTIRPGQVPLVGFIY